MTELSACFSRWPSGIFARAFIRDYARAVGLDADDIVDEFCRLFPQGDRRVTRIIRGQAELIGHTPAIADDPGLLPPDGDRRASGRNQAAEARARRIRFAPRTVAAPSTDSAPVDRALGTGSEAPVWARRARRARRLQRVHCPDRRLAGVRANEVLGIVPAVFTSTLT